MQPGYCVFPNRSGGCRVQVLPLGNVERLSSCDRLPVVEVNARSSGSITRLFVGSRFVELMEHSLMLEQFWVLNQVGGFDPVYFHNLLR